MATTMATPRPRRTALDRALIVTEILAGVAVVLAIIGKTYGVAPTLFFLIAGGSVAFSGWAIAKAVLAWRDPTLDVTGRVENRERDRLEHEKLLILQGIKELEVDFQVGKVDPRDYDSLRRSAEDRALLIIQKLKDEDARWMRSAEDLVRQRLGKEVRISSPTATRALARPAIARVVRFDSEDARKETADARLFDERPVAFKPSPEGLACGGCGTRAEPEARFCIGCGRPRAEEVTT